MSKYQHRGDGVVHFIIVVVGNLHKHFWQRAGLFTGIDHAAMLLTIGGERFDASNGGVIVSRSLTLS